MDSEELGRLYDARDTICEYCRNSGCVGCFVRKITNDAFNELGNNVDDD